MAKNVQSKPQTQPYINDFFNHVDIRLIYDLVDKHNRNRKQDLCIFHQLKWKETFHVYASINIWLDIDKGKRITFK